ncbi:MAG: hypothetical protein CMB53_03275 [Euryarchaeota archaeon]|nr:hypothetical protein [Euryarchaeota archaeon]
MIISRGKKFHSRSSRKGRKSDAAEAIAELSKTLSSHIEDKRIADAAARDIIRVGRRHGTRAAPEISRMICRKCLSALSPGNNSRIRIESKQVVSTCDECGNVTRRSPGD